jgi:preprotein translocase subunit Sec61beta
MEDNKFKMIKILPQLIIFLNIILFIIILIMLSNLFQGVL